ncbi:hypothetical protein NHQ30_010589 [Ciborinia camelliae]|nr:hypothetical protein NHQ30_010589 [Ciborinia camelliae]
MPNLGLFFLPSQKPKGRRYDQRDPWDESKPKLTNLDAVLGLFAKKGSDYRFENLNTVIQIGEEFGVLLFCQSFVWEFNWSLAPEDEYLGTSSLQISPRIREPGKSSKTHRVSQKDAKYRSGRRPSARSRENPQDSARNVNQDYSKSFNSSHLEKSPDKTQHPDGNHLQVIQRSSTGKRERPLPENSTLLSSRTQTQDAGPLVHCPSAKRIADDAKGDKTWRPTRVEVFPALLKTSDEHGRAIPEAIELSKPEMAWWFEKP